MTSTIEDASPADDASQGFGDDVTHPSWCSIEDRIEEEESHVGPRSTIRHLRPVEGDFLPEVRRWGGPVTREHLGVWGVSLERNDVSGFPADEVVTVELNFVPTGLRFLPGEALVFAAALIRAVDMTRG
jgi:hypothetical protein